MARRARKDEWQGEPAAQSLAEFSADAQIAQRSPDDLPERRAQRLLEHDWQRLNQMLGRNEPLPRLRFDLRGRCAGQARYQDWVIRLNPVLMQGHGDRFIEETVPHELAHLMAFRCHGAQIRPHGREWRAMLEWLQRPVRVSHDYEVSPSRRLKRYVYRCDCRLHELSSIRHRRAEQGTPYQCRMCGCRLRKGDARNAAC